MQSDLISRCLCKNTHASIWALCATVRSTHSYLLHVRGSLGWGLHEYEAVFSGKCFTFLLLHFSPGLQITGTQANTFRTSKPSTNGTLTYSFSIICRLGTFLFYGCSSFRPTTLVTFFKKKKKNVFLVKVFFFMSPLLCNLTTAWGRVLSITIWGLLQKFTSPFEMNSSNVFTRLKQSIPLAAVSPTADSEPALS